GRLVGHRELRRLRPDRGAGRESVRHQPGGLARPSLRLYAGRRHDVAGAVVGVRPVRHRDPVVRGVDRRPARRHHRLGPDDPQRRGVHRRGVPAAEDLRRPGAGDAVLDREPGPHPAAGERRPSRHVRGGGGDLRHPGGAPRPQCARRRAGRRADRPRLWRREFMRTARIAAVSIVTLAIGYSAYGLVALKPLFGGLQLVTLPSPWRVFELTGQALGVGQSTMVTIISFLWPIALIVVAWLIYQRISSDQPREVVAPFALTFAWILVAPWVFAWYTAVAWAALTQVPRNRMTRWLAIVTVLLALCLSSGGRANL